MPTNYPGNPTAVQSPATAPSLTTYPVVQEPIDGEGVTAASVNQPPKVLADNIAYILDRFRDLIFGNGSDGAQSSAIGASLTSPTLADTWSITGGTVTMSGWPMLARTSITLSGCTISGTPIAPGGATSNGYGASPGPHGCIGASGNLSSPQYLTQQYFGLGGSGGVGGSAVSTNIIVSPGNQYKTYPYRFASGNIFGVQKTSPGSSYTYVTDTLVTYDSIRGGACGSAGSGSTAGGSQNGGCGGTGGALVVLIAPTINITNVSFVSNGGNGGAGASGGSIAGSGGGGGGGGAFLFICKTLNLSGSNTYQALAGSGGAAGAPGGTAGASGSNGNATPYVVIVP